MSDPNTDRKSSRLIWVIAALGALALHAGCVALAMTQMHEQDADDLLGAPAIEIGLEMTAPHRDPTDLPPGPDTEASVASPAVAEQKELVKETELPKAVPTETENPDRVVTPDEPKKPQQDVPDQPAPQAQASTESAAVEAMATPSSEAVQEAPRSVAPAQGMGDAARRIRAKWESELSAYLDKHKRYPADRSNKNAEIVVNFVLNRAGHVVSTSIVKSSGDAAFDEAALSMIRRSDPVPKPPPLVADEGLSFTVPVIFKITKGRS
jgi:protein TonB